MRVSSQHCPYGYTVPLRQPKSLRVFIHDVRVAVAVATAQQTNGVMRKTVIERGEPFHRPRVVEIGEDVHVAPERGEKLPGGDVPIAVQPGALLPPRQSFQNPSVFGIVERIVADARGDEARVNLTFFQHGGDKPRPIPRMADTAGIRRAINSWSPTRF